MKWWCIGKAEDDYKPPPPTREERLVELTRELKMWREFRESCGAGRQIYEHYMSYGRAPYEALLKLTITDETAPMWRNFASDQIALCERRLKQEVCGH